VLERDEAKRVEMYAELQRDLLKTSPFIIIYQMVETAGVRKNVQDFVLGATSDSTYVFKVSKD